MKTTNQSIQVGPLREEELAEAGRIVRLAFGTFLGLPNPMEFMGDRDFLVPRWRARNTAVLGARDSGKLIGTNVATRWGSFAFFGPLTVLPEYWNRGIAQQLMASTLKVFDRWNVRHSGLYTFAQSAKHVGLYQKSGYWPGYLTALMRRAPEAQVGRLVKDANEPKLLSALGKIERAKAIQSCSKLTNSLLKGLDLAEEIHAVVKQRIGDVVLLQGRRTLDAFAICMHGPGSEGGAKTCYVKFAAARGGVGAGGRFSRLLGAIDAWALERGAEVEAGVNMACQDAYRRMQAHGFRAMTLGASMQRPHGLGFNQPDAYVISDWR